MVADCMVEIDNVCIGFFFDSLVGNNCLWFKGESSNDGLEISWKGLVLQEYFDLWLTMDALVAESATL